MRKAVGILLCIACGIVLIWLYNVLSADRWAAEDAIRREAGLERAMARRELVRRRVALNEVFAGKCQERCEGHVAGYEWAFEQSVTEFRSCRNQSQSFAEGCRAAVPDVRTIAYNSSRDAS